MIVSDCFQFVFVHNPKCGGTVFRDAVCFAHDYPTVFWDVRSTPRDGRPLDFAHLRLWEVRESFPDVYERLGVGTSFVFVRDPVRRFVSALHHHFREHHRKTVAVDALSSAEKLSLFQRFVRSELCLARVLDDPRFVHFSPQKWFCALGEERVVKHVLPFEDRPLEAAQTLLGIELPTSRWRTEGVIDSRLLTDPLLTDFVEHFYAEDHLFFSALPHLRLTPRDPAVADPIAQAA